MTSTSQPFPDTVEAVRNRKTQKLFIVVDDTLDARYRVINPGGEVLTLPDLLFDEDPITVPSAEFDAEFTDSQLSALTKHLERQAEADRDAAKSHQAKASRPQATVVEAPAPKRRVSKSTGRGTPGPRGIVATWQAPRLAFYRHKIDPLASTQSFRVVVDGTGTFEMTKEEFLAVFNDVVMSPSYRSDGHFSYPQVPPKAMRYKKT